MDVSEEPAAFIFTLNMESAGSFETLVTLYQNVLRHILEDISIHIHQSERPKCRHI
jgi:hypothetical protein